MMIPAYPMGYPVGAEGPYEPRRRRGRRGTAPR